MANLKDIKRKIKSVQNTQKTTRAMKLVSTAKLKRAEMAAKQSRVYAVKINEVLAEIAYKINQYKGGTLEGRFFTSNDTPKVIDVVFVTADKGLCGGFNIQTIKAVRNLLKDAAQKQIKVRLRAVGRKGMAFFNFQGVELLTSYAGVSSNPSYEKAQEIIKAAIDDFIEGKTDKVILVHNGYNNRTHNLADYSIHRIFSFSFLQNNLFHRLYTTDNLYEFSSNRLLSSFIVS